MSDGRQGSCHGWVVLLHSASFEHLVTPQLTLFGLLTGEMAAAFICQLSKVPS
jgi:hypothetical protein